MWTCIRCGTVFEADEAEANVDSFGLHFMCPVCGRRNRLVSLGELGGAITLEQPAEDE